MLQTKKGNPNKPLRIMIYGIEGCGKTTLGAKSDNPIFIAPEGGTDQVTRSDGSAVDEMPGIRGWDDVRDAVRKLQTEQHDFSTIVIDSADWVEKLCHARIIGQSGKSITTCNGGYGAGYRQSEIMHKEFIDDLALLRDQRNMNVVIIAHAGVKTVKDPSATEDYESFEIKCHEMVSSLYREWVDALLFARFKTFISATGNTQKARAMSDGTRIIYTVKQPSFQAKNRYGMPAEIEFKLDFWNVLKVYAKKGESKEQIKADCLRIINELKDEKTKALALKSMEDPNCDLIAVRTRLLQITGGK